MRHLQNIFILLLLITFQSNGQTLESKNVYKLKSRQYTSLLDSTVYIDYINLNPFKQQENNNQITIYIVGLEQRFRFDIRFTNSDTNAFITAYTYEIKQSKPSRDEKKMFPKFKIDKKEEWRLKTRITHIEDTIIKSLLNIIQPIDFERLPNYESMMEDIGQVQMDGISYAFEVRNNDKMLLYRVNSLYLKTHEKLIDLKPIESLILDYINNHPDFKVEYQINACYNSGSIIWRCSKFKPRCVFFRLNLPFR
jgi:hypothetical protein